MTRKASFSVVLAVVVLACTLTSAEVLAQAITVTPANPTISVGQTQQFTAAGVGAATAVELGAFHSCARLQDGALRCWGANDLGQLGNGTTTNSTTPVAVAGITGATAVSGGGYHTCARLADGSLQCWGRNNAGQLGDPTFVQFNSTTPVPVTGVTATAVTAGGFHTCALPGDGTVRCWGMNSFGQLGNGTGDADGLTLPRDQGSTFNATPVTVSDITTAVSISAGGWHTCALLQDGTVRCWGENTWGQLGDGAPIPAPPVGQQNPPPRRSVVPVTVTGITTAVAVEAGIFHTCVILQDGTVRCWGRGQDGRLGNGTATDSSTPTPVSGGITPASLAPGAEHTCAVFQDGTMRCWGDDNWGQLGNGPPGMFSAVPASPVTGITTATAASSGAEHTCAVLQDSTVRCWGRNVDGRLGDGTTTDAFAPVTVTGLGASVTWTSSDTTVATIDASGLATARGPGSTTITATSDARSGSTLLTVVTRPTLSVVPEGTGRGTVRSSDGRIVCGATCSADYESGARVTLMAAADPGSTFEGWRGGDCAGTGDCTLALTANTTVFARFGIPDRQRFALTVARDGTGSGTVIASPDSPDGSYDSGTQVTLTPRADPGSTFSRWSGCDTVSGTTCAVTMNAPRSVTATFDSQSFALTVNVTGSGSGTVTSSPSGIDCPTTSCTAFYESGRQVTLTARANNGSIFEGWSGGGCSGTGDCTVTVTANTTVFARFGVPRFTLSVSREGLGSGTVTSTDGRINCPGACSASYDSGSRVILRAAPGLLSSFDGWSGGGCSGTGDCIVTLGANTTVTARFRLLGLF